MLLFLSMMLCLCDLTRTTCSSRPHTISSSVMVLVSEHGTKSKWNIRSCSKTVLGGRLTVSEWADETALIHTRYIEYSKPDPNSVEPCEKITRLVPKSPNVPWPRSNHNARHPPHWMRMQYTVLFQKVYPKEMGRPTSLQITHERNPSSEEI